MEDVLELASKLGAAIVDHDRYKKFKEADGLLKEDGDAKEISEALEVQSRRIHELEKDSKPIAVEDKKKLRQLKEKAASNPSIQEFLKAQIDYVELMTKINERIQDKLAPEKA